MTSKEFQNEKIERVVHVYSSFKDADKADLEYWISKTSDFRLEAMEYIRKKIYGNDASKRLQRIFEVTQRK
jgi:hypothetical protein